MWSNDKFLESKFELQPLNSQLAEYTIGQYIDWHEDYLAEIEPNLHRVKTFIIPLNDDFKGAKFEVENYGICDIEKGDCLEFDSRLYHRFSPITEGIRYSLFNLPPSFSRNFSNMYSKKPNKSGVKPQTFIETGS